jgi:hypothetical protein
MKEIKVDSTRQTIIEDIEDWNLRYFKQIVRTSKPTKELFTKKIVKFQMLVNGRKSNVFFNGGGNIKPCFLTMVFWFTKSYES